MGRFEKITENLIRWGIGSEKLHGALIIGSQSRSDHPADDFSDLDVILIVDDPEYFIQTDEWLAPIGKFFISFVEQTIAGAPERRILFDEALDVDFVILTDEDVKTAAENKDLGILDRGYRILIDKTGLKDLLKDTAAEASVYRPMIESDFVNLVNDFWYHSVWSSKKLIRGEIWMAKSCVDNYMKGILLRLIECHAHALHGMEYDTWHEGRFLEEWAEEWIVRKLSTCYSHYEREDIKSALSETMDLFRLLAVETAEKMHYTYPSKADSYAAGWVQKALS